MSLGAGEGRSRHVYPAQLPRPVRLVQDIGDVKTLRLPADTPLAYIRQTTLSIGDRRDVIAALQLKFGDIRNIRYGTQNRRTAVRDLSGLVDVILVVGAANSSNSNRLRELGGKAGVASCLIADGGELNPDWPRGAKALGIAAGASAPEVLVDSVIEAHREENIEFRLPAELAA